MLMDLTASHYLGLSPTCADPNLRKCDSSLAVGQMFSSGISGFLHHTRTHGFHIHVVNPALKFTST